MKGLSSTEKKKTESLEERGKRGGETLHQPQGRNGPSGQAKKRRNKRKKINHVLERGGKRRIEGREDGQEKKKERFQNPGNIADQIHEPRAQRGVRSHQNMRGNGRRFISTCRAGQSEPHAS